MNKPKKFQIVSALTTALCIFGVAAILALHFQAAEKNRITYKADLIMEALVSASTVNIANGEWDNLRAYTSKLFQDEEVHHLSITVAGKINLASHFKKETPSSLYLQSFSRDVQTANQKLTTILLVLNTESSVRRMTRFNLEVLTGAILIAALLSLLISFMTRTLYAPIDAIIQTIRHANQGDYSARLPPQTNSDFDPLANGLNKLISHFEEQHNRLKVYSDEINEKNIQMSKQISERLTAQAAFQDTQVRYQAVFDQTFQHTGLISLEGQILELNGSALELFKQSREDLLGSSFIEKYGSPFERTDRQTFRLNFSKALLGNLVAGEWSAIGNDASQCFIEYTLKPVLDEVEGVNMVLYEANDVTAMKEAEAALLESEMQIRQSQKMEAIGRLAGGIAHDFNNLLTSILGYSDLIFEDLEKEHPAREDLAEIIDAAQRARDLTQGLLTLSRKRKVQREPLNLNALIEGLNKIIRVGLDERINYIKKLDESIPYILADKVSIEQILINLTINASHAIGDEGGKVTLQTQRIAFREGDEIPENLDTGDYIILSISDTGCGMSEEVKEHAFEPFFTTKKEKGTGLGLSTVYGIVNQLGGCILLESAPNKGTTFTIYLPASDALPLEIIENALELSSLKGTETVLIVEDSESVRRLAVKILTSLGYKVLTAEDGKEALHVAKNVDYNIDLILSDVVMPNLSGPELIHELSLLGHSLPHIYMTGFPRDKLTFKDEFEESVSLIQKPFTREFLALKIRKCLDLT